MIKQPEDFKDVKIPRNRAARKQLLALTYSDGYWAGMAEGKARAKAEFAPMVKAEELKRQEAVDRRNALQALSNVGEALAKVGQALADVVEPRRV